MEGFVCKSIPRKINLMKLCYNYMVKVTAEYEKPTSFCFDSIIPRKVTAQEVFPEIVRIQA